MNVFLASALLGLATFVNAHMKLASPVAFLENDSDNFPLSADGSNFPCKSTGGKLTVQTMNNITVGESNKLAFEGGATHGGGSCQVSVTMDSQPTKNSQWKVVKSIIGGCPYDSAGNFGDSATAATPTSFEYTLPKGMPNGQYTLAWTWLNRIGNREFYMNCAPIEVSGGADSDMSVFDKLPDMFVANLPPDQCATSEGTNFDFPQPGDDVQTAVSTSLASSLSGSGCAAVTAMGAGSGKAAAPSPGAGSGSGSDSRSESSGSPSSAEASPTASASPSSGSGSDSGSGSGSGSGGNPGGVFAPGASSAITATSMVTVVQPTQAPATSAAAAPTGSTGSGSGSGSGSGAGSGAGTGSPSSGTTPSGSCANGAQACSVPGFYCISASIFGMCANGCAVPQQMAAGTQCSGGAVAAVLAIPGLTTPAQKKREDVVRRYVPRGHAHLHRRGLSYEV